MSGTIARTLLTVAVIWAITITITAGLSLWDKVRKRP